MSKPPSQQRKAQDQKREYSLKFHTTDQFYDLMRLLVRSLAYPLTIVPSAFFLSKAFGQSTELHISGVVSILGDLKFTVTIALAGACAVWAVAERMVRLRVVKKLSPYKKAYEERLDKNRTSSTIAPDGTTNRRDRR